MDRKREYQKPRLEIYGSVEQLTHDPKHPGTDAKKVGKKDMAFIESVQEHGGSQI